MAIYNLKSGKTGREYSVEFAEQPDEAAVNAAIEHFDKIPPQKLPQRDENTERIKEQLGKSGLRRSGEFVGELVKYPFELTGRLSAEGVSLAKGQSVPGMKEDVSGKTIVSTPFEAARQIGMLAMKPVTQLGTVAEMELERRLKNPVETAKEAIFRLSPLGKIQAIKEMFAGREPTEDEIISARAGEMAAEETEKIAPAFSSALPATAETGALVSAFAPGVPGYVSRVKAGGRIIPGAETIEKGISKAGGALKGLRNIPAIDTAANIAESVWGGTKGTARAIKNKLAPQSAVDAMVDALDPKSTAFDPKKSVQAEATTRKALERIMPELDPEVVKNPALLAEEATKKLQNLHKMRAEMSAGEFQISLDDLAQIYDDMASDPVRLAANPESIAGLKATAKNLRGRVLTGEQAENLNQVFNAQNEVIYRQTGVDRAKIAKSNPMYAANERASQVLREKLNNAFGEEFGEMGKDYGAWRNIQENAQRQAIKQAKIENRLGLYEGLSVLQAVSSTGTPIRAALALGGGQVLKFMGSPVARFESAARSIARGRKGVSAAPPRAPASSAEMKKIAEDKAKIQQLSDELSAKQSEKEKLSASEQELADYLREQRTARVQADLAKGAEKGAGRAMEQKSKAMDKAYAKMPTDELLGEFWHSKNMQDVPKLEAAKRALQERLQVEANPEQLGLIQEALFGEKNPWKRTP